LQKINGTRKKGTDTPLTFEKKLTGKYCHSGPPSDFYFDLLAGQKAGTE
jgi:hypothetical protein